MNLVKLLTVDLQSNLNIYNLLNNFYPIFNHEDWVKKYIFWELKLLEIVGYNLQLNKKLNYPDSKIKIYHKHKSCGKY